jgi:hypothetical protein
VATPIPLWANGFIPVAETSGGALKAIDAANAVVAVGTLLWKVVEANRPTVAVTSDKAHVVPTGVDPKDLDGSPVHIPPAALVIPYTPIRVTPPLMGAPLGYLRVIITWSYGRSHKGFGKYITNAVVAASGVALWPADINITVTFLDPEPMDGDVAVLPFTVNISDTGSSLAARFTNYRGEIRGDGAHKNRLL